MRAHIYVDKRPELSYHYLDETNFRGKKTAHQLENIVGPITRVLYTDCQTEIFQSWHANAQLGQNRVELMG